MDTNIKKLNTNIVRPLTEDETATLIGISSMETQAPDKFLETYDKFRKNSFIVKVLEKRIEFFKLSKFEPSALMILSLFSEGNPGRAVLSLIETLEAYDRYHPEKIDLHFICTQVYPMGIYTDQGFEREWERRKDNFDAGYNPIIATR